jgi:hypothetical protein
VIRPKAAGLRAAGLALLAAVLAPVASPPSIASAPPAAVDCRTAPIAERHIFEGQVNRHGRLVGFHHAGAHLDRIVRILRGPNALGVSEAEFRVFGRLKRSTFFPDAWTRKRVLGAIREACAAAEAPRDGRLVGRTAEGLRIQMYLDGRGGIATAFPLYEPAP